MNEVAAAARKGGEGKAGSPTRFDRFRTSLSFAGPAFLVAVGYIDPGNWGTDLAAGSQFGYRLLWVLVVANAMALFLQYLSAKLGIVTGHDLASLVCERLTSSARLWYWTVVEAAMLATEMAEFLGVVVGLRLLLGLGLAPSIGLGALLVVGLLALAGSKQRRLELAIVVLLAMVGMAYVVELGWAAPGVELVRGLLPGGDQGGLPLALGIVGATVMPHNLFLHSGLVQSRRREGEDAGLVVRRSTWETAVALNLALLVNAAILVMAAATFHPLGKAVDSLDEAHRTLTPLLGQMSAAVFALALLASGLASSVTGSLAGQLVAEAFLRLRVPVLVRRVATMVPAIVVLAAGVNEVTALVWSQAALCLVLPVTAWPLVRLTADPTLMGSLASRRVSRAIGTGMVGLLSVLNVVMLVSLLA